MKTHIFFLSIMALMVLAPKNSTAQLQKLNSTCQRNPKCYTAWANEMRSVVLISSTQSPWDHDPRGAGGGSGVLLNNVKSDKTPYILTALHVIQELDTDPSGLTFYFRYEYPCGIPDSFAYVTAQWKGPLTGATIVDSSSYYDIALLKLNQPIPDLDSVYYSGWDAKNGQTHGVTCIHHPYGWPAKLAFAAGWKFNDQYALYGPGWFWTVNFDTGYSAYGSSGSPVFDHLGHALGVVLESSDSCYGITAARAFQEQWFLFKTYLDPQNTGTLVLDGLDPNSVRQQITIDQKLADGTSVDSLGRWMPDSAFRPFPVPDTFWVNSNANETFKATLHFPSSQKYNNWFGKTDVTNIDTVKPSTSAVLSLLQRTWSGIVFQNRLVDVPTLNSGRIGFRDPWLYDTVDNNHCGAPTNRGQTNAIWHDTTSPFNPNMSLTGQHLKYNGVFLNEGDINNLQPPYYSVRVPQSQTLGDYQSRFMGWTATASNPAQFQNADSAQTPVVFQSSPDTVLALYKGYLISSTASALGPASTCAVRSGTVFSNNNLVNGFYGVYSSANSIWRIQSSDGINWYDGYSISLLPPAGTVYRSPTIGDLLSPYSLWFPVVWESVSSDASGVHHFVLLDGHSGFSWDGSNDILDAFTTSTDMMAAPTTASTKYTNGNQTDFAIFWKNPNGITYLDWWDLQNNPPTVDTTGTVPGTTSNSYNYAVASRSVTGSYEWCYVWEERGSSNTLYYGQCCPMNPNLNVTVSIATSSNGEKNINPTIVIDNAGNACVAWEYKNTSTFADNIKFIKFNASGSVVSNSAYAFATLYGSSDFASGPSLTDYRNIGSNNLTLVWSLPTNGEAAAYFRYGVWNDPFVLPSPGRFAKISQSALSSDTLRLSMFVGTNGPPYSINLQAIPSSAPAPPPPQLSSPGVNATGINVPDTNRWNRVFGAESYELQISTSSNFNSTVYEYPEIIDTSQAVSGLQYLTTYYWRVKTYNSNGASAWSSVWSFTTKIGPPAPPTLSSPANNSTNVSFSSPVAWNAASGATDYNLQVTTDSTFSTITTTNLSSTTENGITYTFWYPSLNHLTYYYWRVRSTNGSQTSSWSSQWSFRTDSASGGGGGGGGGCCPYIYVQGDTSLNEENNILPQSEHPGNEGKDVSDYYKLLKPPTAKNGHYELELKEFEHERSFLDQLQLIAVDHPSTDSIAVSSDGSIIQYRTPFRLADVVSGDTTLMYIFSEMDGITYGAGNGKKFNLKVKQNSDAFTTFSNAARGGVLIGGWVAHGYTGQTQCQPKETKVGSASGGDGFNVIEESSQPFTFRERPTLAYVPVKELKDTVTIDIGEKAQIDYVNLAIQVPDNYTTQDLEVVSAAHSRQGSVTSALTNADGSYATLVPGESIRLQFTAPPLDPTLTRSFILVSRGHYEHLADASAIEKPKSFLLSQGYPNPFNPTSTMDYQLAEPGLVSIVVYNTLGQEVSRLVQTQQDAGYYSTAWNAGSSPSGMYYVRMTVSDQSGKQLYAATKKLLLMK